MSKICNKNVRKKEEKMKEMSKICNKKETNLKEKRNKFERKKSLKSLLLLNFPLTFAKRLALSLDFA